MAPTCAESSTHPAPESVAFSVQGSGFRFQGSGSRVQGPGFRVHGVGFMAQGLGNRGYSSGISTVPENKTPCCEWQRSLAPAHGATSPAAVGKTRKPSQGPVSVSGNGEAVLPAATRAVLGSRGFCRPPSLHPVFGTGRCTWGPVHRKFPGLFGQLFAQKIMLEADWGALRLCSVREPGLQAAVAPAAGGVSWVSSVGPTFHRVLCRKHRPTGGNSEGPVSSS